MHQRQIRIRTLLSIVAILATGMGVYRSMRGRLDYCQEWSDNYDDWANSLERKAFWDGHLIGSIGMGPGWAVVAATKVAAAEHRAKAAEFRSAAWRLWRRPPYEPPRQPGPVLLPRLPCPEDLGLVAPP